MTSNNELLQSFAVMSVCWGALDLGQGYDLANQTAYLDDMLRWSLDWLMKAGSRVILSVR